MYLYISAYVKRVIAHPSFHNVDYKTTEKLMANMEQGDVVIRPSSKVDITTVIHVIKGCSDSGGGGANMEQGDVVIRPSSKVDVTTVIHVIKGCSDSETCLQGGEGVEKMFVW